MTDISTNTEAATILVRKYLVERNATNIRLARLLGVSGSAIGSWSRGPKAPLLVEYAMRDLLGINAREEIEPELHDLSTFGILHYPPLRKQRLLCCGNTVMLHCCSKDTSGGVNVSRIGLETLEIYQNERGAECIIRLESPDGWIREVALDALPRKKYETWPDGREGFCIDLWEIDPNEAPVVPAHH